MNLSFDLIMYAYQMGVVIDAGSSHSEAHLFRWDGEKANGTGRVQEEAGVDGLR